MSDGDPTPAPEPTPTPEPERTFTQDEVNRMIQDRVARVKREAPEDYADLKAQAAKWAEYEESQKTELEKAQAAAKKAEKEAARAFEAANKRLMDVAIREAGMELKAVKPEHLPRLIDTSSVTVGDDGQVTGASEAVAAFLEANPEYVGKPRVKDPVDLGARGPAPGQISREELRSMSPAEIVKAQNEGRLNDVLGIKQ